MRPAGPVKPVKLLVFRLFNCYFLYPFNQCKHLLLQPLNKYYVQ